MKVPIMLFLSVLCLCSLVAQDDVAGNQKKAEARKYYNEALQYAKKGDYPVAFSSINSALVNDPDFDKAMLMRARLSFQLNNTENALKDINKVLNKNANNGEAKFIKGFVLMHTDPTYHDSTLFIEALEDGYQRADVYYQLGLLHLDIQRYNKAREYLSEAITLKPDFALAMNDLGTVHYELNDFDGAIHHYKQAIEFDPDFIDAYNNLGTARKKNGDFDGAIEAYSTALQHDSTYYAAYNNRGAVYMGMGEKEKAIEDFEKALTIDDSYASALCNLGIFYTGNNEFNEAMEYFNKAVSANPEHGKSYLNRGLANEMLGNINEACEDWQEALVLGKEEAEIYLEDCD